MNRAEIAWWIITALLLLALAYRAFEWYYTECRKHKGQKNDEAAEADKAADDDAQTLNFASYETHGDEDTRRVS